MPTYQYACTACAEQLEVVQKFTDDALTECPTCAGRLRKVYSAVGVLFKGSGFYRTDSRAAANGSSAAESTAAVKSSESGSAGEKAPSTDSAASSGSGNGSSNASGNGSGRAASNGSSTTAPKASTGSTS